MAVICIPTRFKKVQIFAPKTTNANLTSTVVSLKNAVRATITLHFTQAVGHATTPTLKQATDIAAGTNAAGPTSRIWANEDTATSDALVEKTAAASYAVTNDVKNKIVIFEVDPAALTDGYDCVYITIGTSAQATNFVSGEIEIETNFAQATPPSVIVD